MDVDGTRDLAGLLVSSDGTSIKRTIVQLTGAKAVNGTSSTVPNASPAMVELVQPRTAHQVTCGDLILVANGVRMIA